MKSSKIISGVLCLMMLLSCISGMTIVSADTTLTVSITPAEDQTIAVSDSIEFTFNGTMNESTLTNITIEKLDLAGVGTATTYSGIYANMKYTVNATLAYNSRYKITVPTTVTDLSGNTTAAAVVRTFNTFSVYHRGTKTQITNETFDQYSSTGTINDTSGHLYNATTNPLAFGRFATSGTSPSLLQVVQSTDENSQQSKMFNAIYGTNYYQPIYGSKNSSKLVGKTRIVVSYKFKVSNVTSSTFAELQLRTCDTNTGTDKHLARVSNSGKKLYLFGGTASGTGLAVTIVPTDWNTVVMELDTSGANPVSKYALVNGTLVTGSINRDISDSMYSLANFTNLAGKLGFQNSGNGTTGTPVNWYLDDIMIYEPESFKAVSTALGADGKIYVGFNSPVDNTTLDGVTLFENGQSISATKTLSTDGKTCILETVGGFDLNKSYVVKASGVNDILGYVADAYVGGCGKKTVSIMNYGLYDGENDEIVGNVTAGQAINVKADAFNSNDTNKSVWVVIATYNGSQLVDADLKSVSVVKNDDGTLSLPYTVGSGTSGYTLKAFVWDEVSLSPLANLISRTVQ